MYGFVDGAFLLINLHGHSMIPFKDMKDCKVAESFYHQLYRLPEIRKKKMFHCVNTGVVYTDK